MRDQPLFDPEGPEGTEPCWSTGLPEWLLPSQPTDRDRAVIDRILRLESEARESAVRLKSATCGARDLARLDDLGSVAFTHEAMARASHARGLRAVLALVTEMLAQDRADHGRERSEAMEHAVHEVAAALGVNRRTAEIRIEQAMELVELPRTLALLEAGYLPIPSAHELARRLAGQLEPLRTAVEIRVLDLISEVAEGVDLALGSDDLEELVLTASLAPSVAATVSVGASRTRVRDLTLRALRALTPEFEEAVESTQPQPVAPEEPRPGDVEFWPTRPGFTFVGSELPDADAARVLERNDSLARRDKRAGDPRSLPELRGTWFRDLLLAGAEGLPGAGNRPDGSSDGPGLLPVPLHLTVHLLDDRTAVDSERLGPLSPETLSDLFAAARRTDGAIRVRPVLMSECAGTHHEPGPYEPSPALREAVIARDRTCRFPGCTVPARSCDLDHSVPHPRGPTCHCNLCCLCRRHHRLKTSGRWKSINHGLGRLTWVSPIGRTYEVRPDFV